MPFATRSRHRGRDLQFSRSNSATAGAAGAAVAAGDAVAAGSGVSVAAAGGAAGAGRAGRGGVGGVGGGGVVGGGGARAGGAAGVGRVDSVVAAAAAVSEVSFQTPPSADAVPATLHCSFCSSTRSIVATRFFVYTVRYPFLPVPSCAYCVRILKERFQTYAAHAGVDLKSFYIIDRS